MSDEELRSLLGVLKVLADESRLRMVGILATGERSGAELAQLLDLRAATVSHHLSRLTACGLVAVRKDGASRRYRLDTDALQDVRERALDPGNVASLVSESAPHADAHTQGDRIHLNRDTVLRAFFDGDTLTRIPAHRKKREVVLQWLAERFPLETDLSEAEVNEGLQRHHWDSATLRRELVGGGWMTRATGIYRRVR